MAIRINFYARISQQTSCSSILLPRIEDAALKFRGCFQAICELRSENQQGEDQRVVYTSRQGVVVLEPIYPTSLLRHISLSLSLILPLFPFLSLCPNFPSLSLPLSLPRYGSPSATLCLLCIRRRRETNSYLFMSFRFILARPLRKKKNRSRNNLERRDISYGNYIHEDILSRSISLYFQCNYIIVYLLSKISPPPPSIRFDNYILREKKIPVREKKSGSRYVGVRKKKKKEQRENDERPLCCEAKKQVRVSTTSRRCNYRFGSANRLIKRNTHRIPPQTCLLNR